LVYQTNKIDLTPALQADEVLEHLKKGTKSEGVRIEVARGPFWKLLQQIQNVVFVLSRPHWLGKQLVEPDQGEKKLEGPLIAEQKPEFCT